MGVLLALSAPAGAADVSVSADLASAYVFRGDTFNDGLVFQPGMEATALKLGETVLPITLGVWGNLNIDDYDGALEENAFSEVDIYGSVDVPTGVEKLGLSLGYCEYTYPNSTTTGTAADGSETTVGYPSDREVSVGLSLDVPLAPSITAYYGVDGLIEESLYVECGISHEVDLGEGVTLGGEAKAGYLSPEEGKDGFKDYTLTASLSWKILTASVSYIGQIDDEILVDSENGGLYDVDVVGVLGISQSF